MTDIERTSHRIPPIHSKRGHQRRRVLRLYRAADSRVFCTIVLLVGFTGRCIQPVEPQTVVFNPLPPSDWVRAEEGSCPSFTAISLKVCCAVRYLLEEKRGNVSRMFIITSLSCCSLMAHQITGSQLVILRGFSWWILKHWPSAKCTKDSRFQVHVLTEDPLDTRPRRL